METWISAKIADFAKAPKQLAISLAAAVFGFFLGRIGVFQFVSPLAVPFLAAFLGTGPRFFIICAFVLLGLLSKFSGLYLVKYIIAAALLYAAQFAAHNMPPWKRAAAASVSVLVSGLVLAMLMGFSAYFAVAAIVEAAFCLGAAVVLQSFGKMIAESHRPRLIAGEELVALCVVFAATVLGGADISFNWLSLRLVLASAGIMAAAFAGGGGMAAAAGLLAGTLLFITGITDSSQAAVLGLAGLTAGVFGGGRRGVTALAYTMGYSVAALYLDKSALSAQGFISLGVASLIFAVLPQTLYFNPSLHADSHEQYLNRVRGVISRRLLSFASSFDKLARTFDSLARHKTSLDKNDVSLLIDDIADKACSNCGMRAFCWEKNFYVTYQTVFGILNACEKKNRIDVSDIPDRFKQDCANVLKFVTVTNRIFEINKLNMAWRNRIVESRALVSEQLGGVARLIESLGAELDFYMNFKPDLERTVSDELMRHKIEAEQMVVLENKDGKLEVSFCLSRCIGQRNCSRDLVTVISRVLGRKMRLAERECTDKKYGCRVVLAEEQKFRITSGVARIPKTGSRESGDNYSFMEMKNGQALLALSDGMGSGRQAREESAAAVELLEDFMESGFEKDMAVRMINSALVMKSDTESFSTMDICAVDLYSGRAEFIKIGAAAAYIVRDGAVLEIKSSSLPIGMLNTVDWDVTTKILRDGDMIVMMTDGMMEIEDSEFEKEVWVQEKLRRYRPKNPQDLADYLLEQAAKINGGQFRDDTTVLTARIWQSP